MTTNTIDSKRRTATAGVGRLVRRLERERRSWARRPDRGDVPVVATEVAWRAGVAEGLRVGGGGGGAGGAGGGAARDPQGGLSHGCAQRIQRHPPVEPAQGESAGFGSL